MCKFLFGLTVLMLCAAAESSWAAEKQPVNFDLWELRVKGNSLLDSQLIEMTVYPFLGPGKSIETVEQARAALETVYQSKGYQTVGVDIPEQDVVNGIVYLQVVEGKIERLRVKNSRYFSLGKIKQAVPELAEGNVPNMPKMQEQLAELSRQSSDRKIVPVMRAGKTPGTLEVDLNVRDTLPFHGEVTLNGRNSQDTSRLRLVTQLSYANLWQEFHSGSVMFQTSPENFNEVQVFAGTYVMPVFDSQTRLALYAVSSQSDSQIAQAGDTTVIGEGEIYGIRLIRLLETLEGYRHNVTLGVDYKDFGEDVLLGGVNARSAPISYLPFTAKYSGVFSGADYSAGFDIGMNFSFRGLLVDNEEKFSSDDDEKDFKRKGSRSNFFYLTLDGDFRYQLPWGMELFSRFSGQVADSPLISNEQFSMGGATSVRGYFESQVLVDDGVMGGIEVHSPRLVPDDWEFVDRMRALVFADAGHGWRQLAQPGEASQETLYSAGVGLRFQLWRYLIGALDYALPLISNGTIGSGESRWHFNVGVEF